MKTQDCHFKTKIIYAYGLAADRINPGKFFNMHFCLNKKVFRESAKSVSSKLFRLEIIIAVKQAWDPGP